MSRSRKKDVQVFFLDENLRLVDDPTTAVVVRTVTLYDDGTYDVAYSAPGATPVS